MTSIVVTESLLTAEQLALLERVHLDFERAGVRLPAVAKARIAAIAERLATLSAQFGQNVLADESNYRLPLENERISRACLRTCVPLRARPLQRGENGAYLITPSRSLIVPFLTFSERRDLREQAFKAWTPPRRERWRARQPPRRARC